MGCSKNGFSLDFRLLDICSAECEFYKVLEIPKRTCTGKLIGIRLSCENYDICKQAYEEGQKAQQKHLG